MSNHSFSSPLSDESSAWAAWPARDGADGLNPSVSGYPSNMKTWMICGPFDLREVDKFEVVVDLWFDLDDANIRISMDGRGRAFDNIFVERLWRTVKYEDIYIRDYASMPELARGLGSYFHFYNHERYHQSLDYAVPAAVHFAVKEQTLASR